MPKSNIETGFFECPCAGTTLDKLIQPAVLAVLTEEPMHGYELAKRIGEIPCFLNEAPDISGIYRILKTLEQRGIVVSDWDVTKGERAKRIYSITKNGHTCLKHWQKTLQQHRQTIDALLKFINGSPDVLKPRNVLKR